MTKSIIKKITNKKKIKKIFLFLYLNYLCGGVMKNIGNVFFFFFFIRKNKW